MQSSPDGATTRRLVALCCGVVVCAAIATVGVAATDAVPAATGPPPGAEGVPGSAVVAGPAGDPTTEAVSTPPNDSSDGEGPQRTTRRWRSIGTGAGTWGVGPVAPPGNDSRRSTLGNGSRRSSLETRRIAAGSAVPTVLDDHVPVVRAWSRTFRGSGPSGQNGIEPTESGGYVVAETTAKDSGGIYGARGRVGTVDAAARFGGFSPIGGRTAVDAVERLGEGRFVVVGTHSIRLDSGLTKSAAVVASYGPDGSRRWVARPHDDQITDEPDECITSCGPVTSSAARGATPAGAGVLVTGSMQKPSTAPGATRNGVMLMRIDGSGNEQYNRTLSVGEDVFTSSGNDIAGSEGEYVVAGVALPEGELGSRLDGLLVGTAGREAEWSQRLGGSGFDVFNDVEPTADGGFVVAGTEHTGSDVDAWLVKVFPNGTVAWQRTYGGPGAQGAAAVVQSDRGNFTVAGGTATDGDPSPWLIHTTPDGAAVWNATLGRGGTGSAQDVAIQGDYYAISGVTGGWIPGDVRPGAPKRSASDSFVTEVIRCRDTVGDGDVDTDDDALCDNWEVDGFDVDGDSDPELDLPGMGADPLRKDLFVEVDHMAGHAPSDGSLERIESAFADAPVSNPGDSPDGIDLHIQTEANEEVPHHDYLVLEEGTELADPARGGDVVTLDEVKYGDGVCAPGEEGGHFGRPSDSDSDYCQQIVKARTLVFRYGLIGDRMGSSPGTGGRAELPGDDFIVTLGGWANEYRDLSRLRAAVPGLENRSVGEVRTDIESRIVMHELGHTLSLRHGGGTDSNFKPNYLSVMNYAYTLPKPSVTFAAVRGTADSTAEKIGLPSVGLDYSRVDLPTLDESNLDEAAGIGSSSDVRINFRPTYNGPTFTVGPHTLSSGSTPRMLAAAGGPIDWDLDGTIESGVQENLDEDGEITTLEGHDDWTNLRYNHRATADYGAAVSTSNDTMVPADLLRSPDGGDDFDGDGVDTVDDNCPWTKNADQADANGDGRGDACSGGDPPIPAISYDEPSTGERVTFDGTGSTDPDGLGMVAYRWGFPNATAVGPTANYTFESAGTYTVTLTVTDANASSASTDVTVTVEEGSDTEGPVARADTDGDGDIDDAELRAAIVGWSSGEFSDRDLRAIVVAWSSS